MCCVYVYWYVWVCMWLFVYVCVGMCGCVDMCVCMCVFKCVCVYMCLGVVCGDVCGCLCVCVCEYVVVCVCVCVSRSYKYILFSTIRCLRQNYTRITIHDYFAKNFVDFIWHSRLALCFKLNMKSIPYYWRCSLPVRMNDLSTPCLPQHKPSLLALLGRNSLAPQIAR